MWSVSTMVASEICLMNIDRDDFGKDEYEGKEANLKILRSCGLTFLNPMLNYGTVRGRTRGFGYDDLEAGAPWPKSIFG